MNLSFLVRRVWITGLVIATAVPALGQTPQATPPPLPPGPLIQKSAPAAAEWSITCKYAAPKADKPTEGTAPVSNTDGAGASPAAKEAVDGMNKVTVITKVGDRRREITTRTDRSTTTVYYVGDVQIVVDPYTKIPNLLRSGSDVSRRKDFSGFGWISEKNYTGLVKVQNRDCLVFRGEASGAEQDRWADAKYLGSDTPVKAVAVIDLETRLPFSVQVGDETRVFRFGNAPTEPIVFPPEIQKVIDDRRKRVQAENVAPPPP